MSGSTDQASAALSDASLAKLEVWLINEGLVGDTVSDLVRQFAERLSAAGYPLLRLFVGLNTLHPLYNGFGYAWKRGGAFDVQPFMHGQQASDDFSKSPFSYMFSNRKLIMRKRLHEKGDPEFEIYESFRAAGGTDYIARLIAFSSEAGVEDGPQLDRRQGMLVSGLVDAPGGFDEATLQQFHRLSNLLALTIKSHTGQNVARNLALTYLGADAGNRVLNGEIVRGGVQRIRAVIFYADLRGFTRLSDQAPDDELVPLLDDYLECMARPVLDRGGEVLKFLGDGLLGVFEIEDNESTVECGRALQAAVDAIAATERLNSERRAEGKAVMDLDVALHVGDVLYGNVGAEERLEFTVIGPAVNEASRLETMCRPLDRALLVSEAFAAGATDCRSRLISLGRHELRDLDGLREIFTLDLQPAAA